MRFDFALPAVVIALGVCQSASANDRKFAYTYETAVLPPGGRELEVWTTWHTGRKHYYSSLEHRLELEVGVVDRLQSAFYLNLRGVTAEDDRGERDSSFRYEGVSWEWKYKLSDPVADVLGSAVYAQASASTHEYELEGKLLFDKVIGDLLLAFNLVGEIEWELEADETETAYAVGPLLAVSYLATQEFGFGLEARNLNALAGGELESSIVSLGPVISYTEAEYWATLAFLPQITDLKSGKLELRSHERYELRLLLSMHL